VSGPRAWWGRAWRWRRVVAAALSAVCVVVGVWIWAVPFDRGLLGPENITSVRLVDRRGEPLREVLGPKEGRARWSALGEVSPWLVVATLHAEDQRFLSHLGLDVRAIARSARINMVAGRVVTGASTITQQVVKLLMRGTRGRTLGTKLDEAVWALRLERALSKEAILEQYVNRVPYGNQLYGVGAASWMYFDKPPGQLTLAEGTFLAVIPRSPGRLDPYARPEAVRAAQRVLLDKMLERGAIDEATWGRAVEESLRLVARRGRVVAPHFTEEVLRRLPEGLAPQEVRTTLDLVLQRQVEGIVGEALRRLGEGGREVDQAAVVVLETQTGEVRAWVGSGDYWDVGREGANDGVLALRQPGSALKPFVYGLYFEGGGGPGDVLLDGPVQFAERGGVYVPKNYDQRFHGPVTARAALGSSLNIPAVLVAQRVGVEALWRRLRALGFGTLVEEPDYYGLALALGDGEVRLLDLASAYATLGRLGVARPVRVWEGEASVGDGVRVFSARDSFLVVDVLADDDARGVGFGRNGVLSLPYKVAIKTGTSASYRDNWAVAVGPEVVVAVWAGNFDGRSMAQSSGVVGAAPILRRVLQTIYPEGASGGDVPWFEVPEGLERRRLCGMSGHVAGALCERSGQEWVKEGQDVPACVMHERVEVVEADGLLAGEGCGAARAWRVGHRVPAGWQEWAKEQGVLTLPRAVSPQCAGGGREGASGGGELRMVHPLGGDVFYRAPEGSQIVLRATLEGARAGEELMWYVDGRQVARVRAPFVARWTLEEGAHRVGVGRGRVEVEQQIEVR
jgi:penicillin-binding protein 1C